MMRLLFPAEIQLKKKILNSLDSQRNLEQELQSDTRWKEKRRLLRKGNGIKTNILSFPPHPHTSPVVMPERSKPNSSGIRCTGG
jgi:hypothetical protein